MRDNAEILEHWQAGRSIVPLLEAPGYAEQPFASTFMLPGPLFVCSIS
ncbi:hypothetical protein ACFLVS_02535 [Chloroflexota bacterium]